jgi:hypothetical protein
MEAQNHKIAVSTELHCLECRREWLDSSERWRMYVVFGEETEQGLYCPICASFEFDE